MFPATTETIKRKEYNKKKLYNKKNNKKKNDGTHKNTIKKKRWMISTGGNH